MNKKLKDFNLNLTLKGIQKKMIQNKTTNLLLSENFKKISNWQIFIKARINNLKETKYA